MQERTALEDQLTALGRIQQELDDQIMLIELGEAEKDQAVITDAENALRPARAAASSRRSSRARRRRTITRSSASRMRTRTAC